MFIYKDLPKSPYNHEKGSVKDFNLFKHPIFQWRNDMILSYPIKHVERLIKGDSETKILSQITGQFKKHLYQLVFRDKKLEEIREDNALGIYQKTLCGRRLGESEVYFRCLDCEKFHEEETALCEDCFVKSNHQDHRVCQVILSNEKVGVSCDCGNERQMSSEGFCPDHQASQMDAKELLARFPVVLFERYQYVLKKAFYGAVCLFELAQRAIDEKLMSSLIIFADQNLQEVLSFCEDCSKNLNESFLSIFGIVMSSKFIDPYNKICHDCQDLKAETFLDVKKPRDCQCLMMGNLFRLSSLMRKDHQAKLEKALLRECIRSREFRENLALEYSKYPFYLFSIDFTSNDPQLFQKLSLNSNLATMGSKIYSNERVFLKALKSGCFNNFLSYFKWIIAKANSVTGTFVQTVIQVVSPFEAIDPKWKSSSIIVKESNILKEFLDIMKDFEAKFCHKGKIPMNDVDSELLRNSMIVEKLIRAVLYYGIWIICSFEEEEKIQYSKEFITNCYLNLFFLRKLSGNINFHPGFQRCQTLLVIKYVGYDMTSDKFQAFFKDMGIESRKFAQDMIGGILRVFGVQRYRYTKEKTLRASYQTLFLKAFDIDTVTIQIMAGFIDSNKAFQILTENFFSYSLYIAEFFNTPRDNILKTFSKEEYRVMKDFLEFLIFLMNDELCMLNMKMDEGFLFNKESPLTQRERIVIEKAVKNVLIPAYSMDYAQVKTILTENFMSDHHEIQDIISKVTTINLTDHKIRIKEEFIRDYEPYIFYRRPELKEEYSASVASKFQKDEKFDLLSGSFDASQPEYLQVLQKNIYEGGLGEFLGYFVSAFYQNNENTFSLLQPVLRLILLNLQVAKQESSDSSTLSQKIAQNYYSPEFVNSLEIMSQDQTLKECWLCIKKIQSLLQGGALEEEELKMTEVPPKTAALNSRMAKIKEEFAKKQDKFAHTNKDLMLNENAKPHEESPICQHCLEVLNDKSEDYGIPIFITFTNNLYDLNEEVVFTKQDYTDLSKVSWWPVISSCHHYYHKKCYLETYNKSFESRDSNENYYLDEFEFCCSLCKTICNNFVCVNNTANSGVKQNFATDFLDILTIWKKRLIDGYSGLVPEISILEICKRACEYFIETFYIFDQPKALKQTFDLYVLLLKSLRPYCQTHSDMYDSLLIENFSKPPHSNLLQKQADLYLTDELVKVSIPGSQNIDPQKVLLEALQAYLALRISQYIVISQKEIQTLQDCIDFYKNNPDLPVISDLVFSLQKIMLTWALNDSIAGRKPHLCVKDQLDLNKYFGELFGQVGLQPLSKNFILESLSRQAKKEAFCRLFKRFIKERKINKSILAPKSQRLGAHCVSLPENYLEFTNRYIKNTCSLCHKLCPPHGCMVLCLICGEFQCAMNCGNPKSSGNLNRHCKEYHMGQGYFIHKVKFEKIAINSPRNECLESKGGVYIDKFGQSIENYLDSLQNIHHQDFRQFVLNPSFKQELKETIGHQAIGKVLFSHMMKKQQEPMLGLF